MNPPKPQAFPYEIVSAAGAPRRQTWMITFADLMALLLAFFVLIFSMSDFDSESLADVVASLSSDLVPLASVNRSQSAPSSGIFSEQGQPLDTRTGYLMALISSRFEDELISGVISADRLSNSVILSVDMAALRESAGSSGDVGVVPSLAAFLDTLREPIDIFVPTPVSVAQTDIGTLASAMKSGEATFQQLRRHGYTGEMAIFAAPKGRSGNLSYIDFHIGTGRR